MLVTFMFGPSPFHLLPLADVLGQVAKDGEFRQARAIVKARRGRGFARAARLDEVGKDILRTRQCPWPAGGVSFIFSQGTMCILSP